jgi:hypothetical protein
MRSCLASRRGIARYARSRPPPPRRRVGPVAEGRRRAQHQPLLQVVAQLAHVARPVVLAQPRESSSSRPRARPSPPLARELREQRGHERGQVVEALAQRRQAHLDHREAVVQVGRKRPALTSRRRSRFVAATTRTSTLRSRPPTRRTSPSPSARRSLGCSSSGSSPSSSRKSVPPSARSKAPRARRGAGEGAALVAEELDSISVGGRPRSRPPRRAPPRGRWRVQRAGRELLARARLARHQHRAPWWARRARASRTPRASRRRRPRERPKRSATLSGTSMRPSARHHPQARAPELHLHLAARRDLTHGEGADAGAVAAAEVADDHPVVGGLDLDVVAAHVGVGEPQRGVVGEPTLSRAPSEVHLAPASGPLTTRSGEAAHLDDGGEVGVECGSRGSSPRRRYQNPQRSAPGRACPSPRGHPQQRPGARQQRRDRHRDTAAAPVLTSPRSRSEPQSPRASPTSQDWLYDATASSRSTRPRRHPDGARRHPRPNPRHGGPRATDARGLRHDARRGRDHGRGRVTGATTGATTGAGGGPRDQLHALSEHLAPRP